MTVSNAPAASVVTRKLCRSSRTRKQATRRAWDPVGAKVRSQLRRRRASRVIDDCAVQEPVRRSSRRKNSEAHDARRLMSRADVDNPKFQAERPGEVDRERLRAVRGARPLPPAGCTRRRLTPVSPSPRAVAGRRRPCRRRVGSWARPRLVAAASLPVYFPKGRAEPCGAAPPFAAGGLADVPASRRRTACRERSSCLSGLENRRCELS